MWLQETLGGSLGSQNGNFQGFLAMVIPHLLLNTEKTMYLKFRRTHVTTFLLVVNIIAPSKNALTWFGQFFNNFVEKTFRIYHINRGICNIIVMYLMKLKIHLESCKNLLVLRFLMPWCFSQLGKVS